ncbi:hypothetical protein M1D88_17995 [Arthrobacter sp. R1-13]
MVTSARTFYSTFPSGNRITLMPSQTLEHSDGGSRPGASLRSRSASAADRVCR